jgi:hypothetical protein
VIYIPILCVGCTLDVTYGFVRAVFDGEVFNYWFAGRSGFGDSNVEDGVGMQTWCEEVI